MTVTHRAGLRSLTEAATRLPRWTLSPSQRDDVDLIQTGGFAPLTGFLTREQVASVRADGRLPDATPWPSPVTLRVDPGLAEQAATAGKVALGDDDGTLLAVLDVADRWEGEDGCHHLGGRIDGLRTSSRWDFPDLRRDVGELREELTTTTGPVLAAQPSGPVDARTVLRWTRAAEALAARLLVFPAAPSDPDRRELARVRSYRALLDHLPSGALLRLLPSGRDPFDPEAAALHAVVARNAGATHLLLSDTDRVAARTANLGLRAVRTDRFASSSDPPVGRFHDEVAHELRRGQPARSERGLVVLLSGLSGSGKSTIAKALRARLAEAGERQVTLLDGDVVRHLLSSELGFSQAHRDLNVRRIGYVASEIARHGGIAVCAPIAPYHRIRRQVRAMVERAGGGFVLVHVATPLEVCEARDVKGLYARARAGELTGFTGIDDPYEAPVDAEITIDTSRISPVEAADAIVAHLVGDGWLVASRATGATGTSSGQQDPFAPFRTSGRGGAERSP